MNQRAVLGVIGGGMGMLVFMLIVLSMWSSKKEAEVRRGQLGPPRPGEEFVSPRDGSVMIWIPGGEFTMGREDDEADERPTHKVKVQGFWLSRFEITNKQYANFLSEADQLEPSYWDDERYKQPNMPVVGVMWDEALAYCKWAGLRLPTEAEWEYAAAGGRQLEYPTATGALSPTLAKYRDPLTVGAMDLPAPVGSFAPNPFGLYDMAGNAWEPTSSMYEPYPYVADDGREELQVEYMLRVFRGGCWHFSGEYCRTTYRRRFAAHLRYDYAGIRPALSAGDAAR